MKSYYKIAVLLALSIFITIFISPIIASIIPFHLYRIMGRVVLISTFLLFYYYRNRLGFQGISELGFTINRKWWLFLILGFCLGLFSIGIISVFMLHTTIRFVVPVVNWFGYLAGYIFIGFIVALIEECFFRGFILQALLRDTKLFISLFITNIFYSIVHFLKPEVPGNIEVLNVFSSLRAMPAFFTPLFTQLPQLWPSVLGLFLVGITLSAAYMRTRQLSLPIGLHAGWVVGIKALSLGTDVTTSGSLWINGNVVAQPFTWLVLLIFILILRKNS